MVILHPVLIPVIVILALMRNIVGGIDIDLSVEYMGRGIGRKDVAHQRFSFLTHRFSGSFRFCYLASLASLDSYSSSFREK